MENQSLLETIADFAYILGRSGYFSGDSRADIQEIIYWAKDFEMRNKKTDWDKEDYISKIEEYTSGKISELRFLNNC